VVGGLRSIISNGSVKQPQNPTERSTPGTCLNPCRGVSLNYVSGIVPLQGSFRNTSGSNDWIRKGQHHRADHSTSSRGVEGSRV